MNVLHRQYYYFMRYKQSVSQYREALDDSETQQIHMCGKYLNARNIMPIFNVCVPRTTAVLLK